MKVLTFSRFYPSYHPKKGEPTYFVEKIWKHIWDAEKSCYNPLAGYWERYDAAFPTTYSDHKENIHYHNPKVHTIRAGNRWKAGDFFSPRIWSDKPYRSNQIEFAPPIEIKKVWNFEIKEGAVFINDQETPADTVGILAGNDGLSFVDMMHWFKFPKPFTGQIICWNESIEYLKGPA